MSEADVLVGDYYIPDIRLPDEDDERPVGKWGAMYRNYLKEFNPSFYNHLVLTGRLHSHLADMDEQASGRFECIIAQIMEAEGVTEDLKSKDQWAWIRRTNSIVNRAEEIVKNELIYD